MMYNIYVSMVGSDESVPWDCRKKKDVVNNDSDIKIPSWIYILGCDARFGNDTHLNVIVLRNITFHFVTIIYLVKVQRSKSTSVLNVQYNISFF